MAPKMTKSKPREDETTTTSLVCLCKNPVHEINEKVWRPLSKFSKDSIRLIKRCTKPTFKEFKKIGLATLIGFCLMGFIGFFIKLVHIPINNIIVAH